MSDRDEDMAALRERVARGETFGGQMLALREQVLEIEASASWWSRPVYKWWARRKLRQLDELQAHVDSLRDDAIARYFRS